MSFDDQLAWWREAHVDRVGLASLRRHDGDWISDGRRVREAGIDIAYLMHASMYQLDDPASWPESNEALIHTVDAATELGVNTIYGTTGPKGRLRFEEAVEALAAAYPPAREYAAAAGVSILIETSNPVFAHTHFLHTLRDTIEVSRYAGFGLCLDLHATWTERGIEDNIAEAASLIQLVQVSDFVPRNLTATRDVIGEGIVPFEMLLGAVLKTGYQGMFDLELFLRPRETALADTRLSVQRLGEILERLGT